MHHDASCSTHNARSCIIHADRRWTFGLHTTCMYFPRSPSDGAQKKYPLWVCFSEKKYPLRGTIGQKKYPLLGVWIAEEHLFRGVLSHITHLRTTEEQLFFHLRRTEEMYLHSKPTDNKYLVLFFNTKQLFVVLLLSCI